MATLTAAPITPPGFTGSVPIPLSVVVDDDDDDPVVSTLLATRLGQLGVEVTLVSDGESGVTATRALLPDLVIMDWLMRGMSGLEACEALRDDPDPTVAATPVFLMTSRDRLADMRLGYAAGVSDYFVKPLPLRTLVDRVCAVLLGAPAGHLSPVP
ncbi:MAG: response regulator [Actinomycetota bacterium]|nr:response regulator [Actinomycetota bacterium]